MLYNLILIIQTNFESHAYYVTLTYFDIQYLVMVRIPET